MSPVSDTTFTLTTGNWDLTVTAYLEAAFTNQVARGSTGAAFTVTAGGSTPVSVTLEPEKSTGDGTLTYTVNYPSGATLVSLTWEKLGVVGTTDLKSAATTNTATTLSGTKTPVAVGYYVITAALTESGGKTAGKKEVVHIYDNLTTAAAFTFTATDFTVQKAPISIDATNLSSLSALIAAEAAARPAMIPSLFHWQSPMRVCFREPMAATPIPCTYFMTRFPTVNMLPTI